MRVTIMLLACLAGTPALAAAGFTFGPGAPREYSYPAEPQYQYPSNSRTQRKCPKGQALFQGRCRIMRPVH